MLRLRGALFVLKNIPAVTASTRSATLRAVSGKVTNCESKDSVRAFFNTLNGVVGTYFRCTSCIQPLQQNGAQCSHSLCDPVDCNALCQLPYSSSTGRFSIPAVTATTLLLAFLGAVASTMASQIAVNALHLHTINGDAFFLASSSGMAHFYIWV